MIQEGDDLMVGGFMGVGSPHRVLHALKEKGTKNLTLISNDTAFTDCGVGELVVNKQFETIIATHIGTNKETGRQMMEKETDVKLVPQGTLIECIRAAGFGLGGVLTPTGLGTEVEEGKQIVEVKGEKYLLEEPVKAKFALIWAKKADRNGNLVFHGSTQNFNVMMAAAADITICEVDEIVEIGELDPDFIHCPGVFVDYICGGKG